MGILDMTDEFCNPLNQKRKAEFTDGNIKLGNKLHEQPIVSFSGKDDEQNVIYREEL